MSHSRKLFGLTSFGPSTLYVFGGSGGPENSFLKSCEKYDIINDKWTDVKPLPFPAYCCAVTTTEEEQEEEEGTATSQDGETESKNGGKASGEGGGSSSGGGGGSSAGAGVVGVGVVGVVVVSAAAAAAVVPPSAFVPRVFVFLHGRGVYEYVPHLDVHVYKCSLPLREWFGFSAVCVGSVVYVLGGQCVGQVKGFAWRYDTGTERWEEMREGMLRFRRRAGVALVELRDDGGEDAGVGR